MDDGFVYMVEVESATCRHQQHHGLSILALAATSFIRGKTSYKSRDGLHPSEPRFQMESLSCVWLRGRQAGPNPRRTGTKRRMVYA